MTDVVLGIENIDGYLNLIRNKKVGLITNFTGMTSKFESNYDLLAKYCTVQKIFTPEHGLHGVAEAGKDVESYYDDQLQMEVVSLYGDHHAPNKDELSDVQVLIFDIQDIGIRYYTYIYTLLESMEIAEQASIPFIVMDRPLPLGRKQPQGQPLNSDYFSFVGLLPLPNSYQLTIGELAGWILKNQTPKLALTVVPLKNWDCNKTIVENGLPWVAPSPNLPTLDAIRLYSGLCFIEGTNVSEGRGTVYPFQQIGAPWIDGKQLSKKLADVFGESKCLFQPTWFIPLNSKYSGQVCQGVRFHIVDPDINGLRLGYTILSVLTELYPNKFTCDVISPNIGTRHKFIEYLSGVTISKTSDFVSLIDQYSSINRQYKLAISQYYLY